MSFIADQFEAKIDRRNLLQRGALAGASLLGGGLLAGCGGNNDHHNSSSDSSTDAKVLNFALNLEYLEAEFYSLALTGSPLTSSDTGAAAGNVAFKTTSTTQVAFSDPTILAVAQNLTRDETNHVRFLRSALGSGAVIEPSINLVDSFNAAITAASGGAVTAFDPFADELSFLLGAFIFEDVGVTAYRGGSTLLSNKDYLSAAAGILGVEAYHAGAIRTLLYERRDLTVPGTSLTVAAVVQAISDLRDTADNTGTTNRYSNGAPFSSADGTDDDQGIVVGGTGNIVPVDANGLAFSRTTSQVLPIVYLGSNPTVTTTVNSFFPHGLNGAIR